LNTHARDVTRERSNSYSVETVTEAMLVLLKRRGVDYLYINSGTDSAPLVEAYARLGESRLDFPTAVVSPHENLAVGMAHGYTMITGKPQAVMVHVSVGTANAVCALMNAARENIPIIFTAGRTPLFEKGKHGSRNGYIHWGQEMYDQAGMVREIVKWDYELRDGINVEQVIDRAISISTSEPRGPIYLTMPREILAQKYTDLHIEQDDISGVTEPAPDPVAVDALAQAIAQAKCPVFASVAAGRNPDVAAPLGALAEKFGIGVAEAGARYVTLPSSHPMHVGYNLQNLFPEIDLLVVLEGDVPWIPAVGEPKSTTKIVHVGVDPLFSDIPIRSFRADRSILSSVGKLLGPLSAALERATAGKDAETQARKAHIRKLSDARRARAAETREKAKGGARITKTWMNACLNEAKPKDAIIVNEYWVQRELVDFEQTGTYFSLGSAGGLGWALPAALGAAQASPDRLVIATVGDGAYMFANPTACHLAAAAQELPHLTILCNNGHWGAVEGAARGLNPTGHASKHHPAPLSDLSPSPAFEKYVEASGGYGEIVTDPADLPNAIKRAIKVVQTERRQALLNVICE